MEFTSDYHDNVDDLIAAKDDAWEGVSTKLERRKVIRQFTNMLPTLTPEEAEKLNRTEITNFGMTHRDMLQIESQFTSMVTVTKSLVEIVVDTDNAEQDHVLSQRLTEAINRGAIHYKGKFANFWRKVAGEITITGGCPVTNDEKYGWLPRISVDMFFPKDTNLDADEVPYAFEPVELTRLQLENMAKAMEGKKGKRLDLEAINELIELLKKQVKEGQKDVGSSFGSEVSESVRDTHGDRNATVSAWFYFEVRYDKKGEQYVSTTLFTEGHGSLQMQGSKRSGDSENLAEKTTDSAAKILAFTEKAYDQASEWLHMVFVDSEIGGVKTIDTCRGIAEMVYPSAVEIEDLINLILEGDKMRAKPRLRLTQDADPDEVLRWNAIEDTFAPAGIEELEFRGNSQGLQTPLSMLRQNSAGLAASSVSNSGRGGELRQQAVERQQNTEMLTTNRLSEGYNHLESILETVVWRLLAGPVKPGTDGYAETMWVRAYLDRYDIPYKDLAKRTHGRFEYLRVRVKRAIGNGDRNQKLETADWLMQNQMNYPPASRPLVVHQATVLRTDDPDLSDRLIEVPQAIINAQKITAENEFDTIRRRAAIGQSIPIGSDDIHQDHVPVHLLDIQSLIGQDQFQPWNKLDLLQFAALAEHTADHIQVLMANPETNGEGKVFLQDFQNLVQQAKPLADKVEEQEGSETDQLTAKERADLELKFAAEERKNKEFVLKTADMQKLWEQREARDTLARRKQYSGEINTDKRLKLDAARTVQQSPNRQ